MCPVDNPLLVGMLCIDNCPLLAPLPDTDHELAVWRNCNSAREFCGRLPLRCTLSRRGVEEAQGADVGAKCEHAAGEGSGQARWWWSVCVCVYIEHSNRVKSPCPGEDLVVVVVGVSWGGP